jgi:signal transduction histidine kinase/Flp pilus assembly protein TadD
MLRTLSASLFIFTFILTGNSQSVDQHVEKLEKASTAEAFLTSFDAMIRDLHAGKLTFRHEDVLQIVEIMREKPFENQVIANVYGWAGTMFGDGRMDQALIYFMASVDHYRQQGNKLGEALSYFEMALIQHKAENFAEAQNNYSLALRAGADVLPYRTAINCYNGLALILRHRKAYDTAIVDFRRALEIASNRSDTAWMGILTGNIGSCHLAKGNYDSSLFYYQQNLFFIRRTNEFENEIETYANLGKVYLHKRQLVTSQKYLDSAVSIIRTRAIKFNDFFNPMDQIHETYGHLRAAAGDYKKAYEHQNEFYKIAREKQEKVNSRMLRQLESVHRFTQDQNEIRLLKQINEANATVISQQKQINWSFGLIIVLLGGITFVVMRTGRRRKKINRALSATNIELERLNAIKDMLFSVISHDLRSPIANLRSTLELLSVGGLTEEELSMITERLGHQLEVSGSALENILQWAKAQLTNMAVNPVQVNITALMNDVLAQFATQAESKNLTITNELGPSLTVWADKDQLEVVARNLLSNAIKFTPANGSITISGTNVNGVVNVHVTDSGVGMTKEQIEKLFRTDQHASTPGTNKEKGTGIGLIISREMMLNNGGNILVESKEGQGTRFTFTVPGIPQG